jgi:hypothetical protein
MYVARSVLLVDLDTLITRLILMHTKILYKFMSIFVEMSNVLW